MDPSMPSTTPARTQEDRLEKASWMVASSNVHGMDGDSMCKPANDRRIPTSPSPAAQSGLKGIRFKWHCRKVSSSDALHASRVPGHRIRRFGCNPIGSEGGGIDPLQREIGMPDELPFEPLAGCSLVPQLNTDFV